MMARVSMAITALPRTFSSSQAVPCTAPAPSSNFFLSCRLYICDKLLDLSQVERAFAAASRQAHGPSWLTVLAVLN